MENPFLGGDLGADLASDPGHSANTETKGETWRSERRGKDEARLRVRSLFTVSAACPPPTRRPDTWQRR